MRVLSGARELLLRGVALKEGIIRRSYWFAAVEKGTAGNG